MLKERQGFLRSQFYLESVFFVEAETKSFCFCIFRDTSSSESEESSDSSSDELIGPPLPLQTVEEPVNHMEEDIIGPLPPPLGEEEEDDDDGDSEEEEVSIHW